MRKIELRPRPSGVCQTCEGAGVVLPKKGDTFRVNDAGGFCPDCEAGKERWEATLKVVADLDSSLSGRRQALGGYSPMLEAAAAM